MARRYLAGGIKAVYRCGYGELYGTEGPAYYVFNRVLQDPSVALKDISAACGFCNPSFFTNVFKRETGLRPKDWRKQQCSTPSSEKPGA